MEKDGIDPLLLRRTFLGVVMTWLRAAAWGDGRSTGCSNADPGGDPAITFRPCFFLAIFLGWVGVREWSPHG